MVFFKYLNFEAVIWIGGLVLIYFLGDSSNYFTFCPFNNLGIKFCPGCGLGRSVSELLHLNFKQSFQIHPLGLFALIVLLHRIVFLIRKSISDFKTT